MAHLPFNKFKDVCLFGYELVLRKLAYWTPDSLQFKDSNRSFLARALGIFKTPQLKAQNKTRQK